MSSRLYNGVSIEKNILDRGNNACQSRRAHLRKLAWLMCRAKKGSKCVAIPIYRWKYNLRTTRGLQYHHQGVKEQHLVKCVINSNTTTPTSSSMLNLWREEKKKSLAEVWLVSFEFRGKEARG